MCRILGVARAGYYAWLHQPISERAQKDARLLRLIRASFIASYGIYGAPRVLLDLRERGETCSKHTQFINRLIKSAGSYQNNLNYDLNPQAGTNGYNSNSYVSGVIKAAGEVPPALNTNGEFQAPGYEKPIPLNTGGASGSWGGGASGSWGSGSQNLQSFSKPPPSALNPMPSVRSSK